MPESGIRELGNWIVSYGWEPLYAAESAHKKAEILKSVLLEKLNIYLPEKTVKLTSQDQVWVTPEIKILARNKSKEFSKRRKSPKWKTMNTLYEEKCEAARVAYYINIVSDLKHSNPGQ